MQRHRLARVARHRDTDEVAGADNAVGGIELDPAGARQIDLNPGMRRAAADIAMGAGAVLTKRCIFMACSWPFCAASERSAAFIW